MNYYNDTDPKAEAWIQELIYEKLIPEGKIDTRSIRDVQPGDLEGFTQCHFFAGISGWSLALRLAGWPDSRQVWTGSCPCQPFSSSGKKNGSNDDRNLWHPFMRLIRKRKPEHVFGEQVAAAIGVNWLDRISADLEAEAYSIGSVILGSHSIGSPHIRRRLYWMVNPSSSRPERKNRTSIEQQRPRAGRTPGFWSESIWWKCSDGKHRRVPTQPILQRVADGIPVDLDDLRIESGFPLCKKGKIKNRSTLLKGYGNSINPELTAVFIEASMAVAE